MIQSDSLSHVILPDPAPVHRYNVSLRDGGGMYAETNLGQLVVEPWNAVSSLLLLLPAVYWAIHLKGQYRQYPFITFCIPLLFLGGIGSTLFHAFRIHPFFLYLDVMPTAILTLSLGIYFWLQSTNWQTTVAITLLSIGLRIASIYSFGPHYAANYAYAITGSFMFLPLLYTMYKTHFRECKSILLTVLFFCISLVFRETDTWEHQVFPMGTHFLWHAFSALGAFYLAKYLFFLETTRIRKKKLQMPQEIREPLSTVK